MKNFASSLGIQTKFLILGCGFSGNFFAKTIRQFGCKALTSSRSEKQDPNYFRSLRIKPASIKEIQNYLKDDESLFDYFISENYLFAVLINAQSSET